MQAHMGLFIFRFKHRPLLYALTQQMEAAARGSGVGGFLKEKSTSWELHALAF